MATQSTFGASRPRAISMRQCPFCGISVLRSATQCPACREALPGDAPRPATAAATAPKRSTVRRGLLYMLLAAVIQYFAGGYSGMHLPVAVSGFVSRYLAPLLFLSGLAFALYGLFTSRRSRLAPGNQ